MYLQIDIWYRLHLCPSWMLCLLILADKNVEKGDISSESHMLHTVSYARPRPFAFARRNMPDEWRKGYYAHFCLIFLSLFIRGEKKFCFCQIHRKADKKKWSRSKTTSGWKFRKGKGQGGEKDIIKEFWEYLILAGAYDILCLGKNDESAHKWHAKIPGAGTLGIFYSVWTRWLKP